MVNERPTCSIDGCDNETAARGWCKRHYNQWYKTGTPIVKPRKTPDPCSHNDCDQPSAARGMCKKHWYQWRRNEATEDQLQTTGRRWRGITDQYALTGGEWRVDRHGIQRWHGHVPTDEPDVDTTAAPPRPCYTQPRDAQGGFVPTPFDDDDDPRHGTPYGYRLHSRRKTKPCDPCREAMNEDQRKRRAEKSVRNRFDLAAVERALTGDFAGQFSPLERAEICRRWFESGRSLSELARTTGWRPDRYFKVSEAA